MASTDNRVVSMQFDNQAFRSHIADTLKDLDALNKSLDFTEAQRNMSNLENAGKKFGLGNIGSSVEGVSNRFLAMATIGITALANITNRAVNAGISVAKSLTLDPLMQGFQEYETNMSSIQTILANTASKGTNLTQVNSALDELNTYSDKTIYNFGEMARNIGTFTAAGVDLQTSTASIKGIANLAALSGSNAQQASTAMYQLSQAIAAGSVHLMDWNSVVNAGMGGEVFQKALFETGKALGTLKNVPMAQTFDQWKAAGNTFRSSLSETADASDGLAKAQKDSAKQIASAEERAAESIENATERVANAQEAVAKAAKTAAKEVADAIKSREDTAARGAENIAKAEESQAATFESTTKAVEDAVARQRQTLESNARDVQSALDAVTEAQKRLQEAMKPTGADDLQAATDRVTSSQLDQVDVADDVEIAIRDQKRAAEDLVKAHQALVAVQENQYATQDDLVSATRRVEDAETRSADLADAVERARLRQNAATRAVTEAENQLTEAKKKGTDADDRVIAARSALSAAQEAVVKAREEAAKREAEAAQYVQETEVKSAKQREDAILNVAKVRQSTADDNAAAELRLADTTERAAEQQQQAAENLADAEKNEAKTRRDAQESIAQAHEAAADRIKAANDALSGGMAKTGWLTDKVLTQTLKAFTGDLDEAQLMAMGYTQEQAAELIKMGKIGQGAAQEVKTFSQLMSTVKETIGSGWALTFRTIVGDFEESKKLFTDINTSISAFVGKSADARNNLLQGWKNLGGRTVLINAFKDAIAAVGEVIKPIKQAFRDVFPAKTAVDLYVMTQMFANFTANARTKLLPVMGTIRKVFEGVFSIFSIGWGVLKGLIGVITNIISNVAHLTSGIGKSAGGLGEWIFHIKQILIDGGKLADFFRMINTAIDKFFGFISKGKEGLAAFADAIGNFFTRFGDGGKTVEDATDRISDRFGFLSQVSGRLGDIWDGLSEITKKIADVFGKVWGEISKWLGQLGTNMANAMNPSDFNGIVDILNVGLLAGIVVLLKKLKDLFSGDLDIGHGIFAQIKDSLNEVTKTLGAMQTQLKAKALMEIAIALGILTASIVVLSLIDSAALTKAMIAISFGFGELIGAMSALDKVIGSSADAAKMGLVAISLNLLATSMVILAGAVKIMASMSWAEIAKGLVGITAGLGIMIGAMYLISTDPAGLIASSIAMVAMATAMTILGGAMKIFATMSWEDLAKGLVGLAGGLAIMVGALLLMPIAELIVAGLAMIPLSIGLGLLAGVIVVLGLISWETLGKGLLGLAAALGIIAVAMNLMPITMPLIAWGLLKLSDALIKIGAVIIALGLMDVMVLVKGIGAIAAVLAVLAAAMFVMQATLGAAGTLVIVAGALAVLAAVIKTLGGMSIKEIAIGIGAIAAVFLVLSIAAMLMEPVLPLIAALGIALGIVGVAFALFGVGAILVAKAFEVMAKAGKIGTAALIDSVVLVIQALPRLASALVHSLVETAEEFLQAGTTLLKIATVFLGQMLDTVIVLAPKIAAAILSIVLQALKLIKEAFPDVLDTGIKMLYVFLSGIKKNIGWITQMAIDIVTEFLDTLAKNAYKWVDSAVNLLTSFLRAISDKANDITAAGLNMLLNFLAGMINNLYRVIDFAVSVLVTLVQTFGNETWRIIDAGADLLIKFIEGIGREVWRIADKGVEIAIKFLDAMATDAVGFVNKAANILVKFLNGMAEAVRTNAPQIDAAADNLVGAIIQAVINSLKDKADKLPGPMKSIMMGMIHAAEDVLGIKSPSKVFYKMALNTIAGFSSGIEGDTSAENSVVDHAERIVRAFQKTISNMPTSLEGIDTSPVIRPVLDLTKVEEAARGLGRMISVPTITPDVSLAQARLIATTADVANKGKPEPEPQGPTEIKFEQNNYSPKPLSTNDIYRNTRSQLALKKEDLQIP